MVKLVLTLALVASASALPQLGGSLDNFISGDVGGAFISGGDGAFISGSNSALISGDSGLDGQIEGASNHLSGISLDDGCPGGQVRHGNGECVTPEISTDMFLYAVPARQFRTIPATDLPKPKVHLNYVFVRTENNHGGARPVVAPAPKQKTIVYVLNKAAGAAQQEVIEVPHTPTKPEVFIVNFDDENDNKKLHGGIDLQTALRQSVQQAQIIHAGESEGSSVSVGSSVGGVSGGSNIVGGGNIIGVDTRSNVLGGGFANVGASNIF